MTSNNQGSAFSSRDLASKVRSILSLLSIIDYNVLPLLLVINGGVLFLFFIIDCLCSIRQLLFSRLLMISQKKPNLKLNFR